MSVLPEGSSPPADASRQHRPLSRVAVADIAVRLFLEQGYEATSTVDIAEAAGVSRSTFFRQFRSKDDVIFADHDELIALIGAYFTAPHDDPWRAVTEAATMVFKRFRERLEIVRIRDQVVRQTPVLRDRETIMAIRYERIFASYLRAAVPDVPALTTIRFAAAVTATHNYVLRRLIRGAEQVGTDALDAELAEVSRLFHPDGVANGRGKTQTDAVIVAVFPAATPPGAVARAIEAQLRSASVAPSA
ncbi:TetR family transcriptional regulator [Cryobacterium sp. TMT1-21]|uniref:TetR family transcriptional regulator n=1 Tax=Cryobacterium shii TaxID=1259235 RepID=A0AAQ2C692_9MICO|nr:MULTISPECIES: TetR/AcrR family transcriptional regulator [Cryobacterium]TFC47099.1 TetR family transcriptional regulator [Cryobacterium shii]TFC88204.1 TetR family transcriptional regulator [Cryobacterium sp. TmT2-59]TFD13084.1 TetR family transcriptional regulator [Cryobacterium sp. TMT4-10]TFD13822.1 TetR family transcriptional regulator [Cryobacterium sp. TMT1-21]TFD16975.1 TetR family transcriptional regulator [Cryobacterium sp. TMT2-23]